VELYDLPHSNGAVKLLHFFVDRYLAVEPQGFPGKRARDTSIGKYQSGLSAEELATVLDIAGPTMARLGYHA
jgi:hypothetical protein